MLWTGEAVDRGVQDQSGQSGGDPAVSVGAQRVRDHRSRRRAAGLVEVKAWVRATDVDRAHAVLRPLTDEAGRDLARHTRQGQTNQVAVTVRFPHTPPHAFREEVLRRAWGLAWDRSRGCWHGMAEDTAAADELRRAVVLHGGVVQAG